MRPVWTLLFATLLWSAAMSCSDDPSTSDDPADAGPVTDSGADAAPQTDAAQQTDATVSGCEDAICGTITYSGVYAGPTARIYVRAYKDTDSLSSNPLAAVGHPDFETSIEGVGEYRIELEGYQGSVTLSAFMDVDGSGSEYGPNGRAEPLHGLYSDPLGAYGGYTFEGDPQTAPTPVAVDAAGAQGIDIELKDSGVVTGLSKTWPA